MTETAREQGESEQPMHLDKSNSLLVAHRDASLESVGKFAADNGYLFPFGRPLPSGTLGEICHRFSIFSDAFVARLQSRLHRTGAMASIQAPRAAVGPDFIGSLMQPLGAANFDLICVRVFSVRETKEYWFEEESLLRVEQRIQSEMRRGHVFCVEAEDRKVRMLSGLSLPGPLEGHLPKRIETDPEPAFLRDAYQSAHFINWALEGAVLTALEKSGRILAAPFMGRLGVLDVSPAASLLTTVEDELGRLRQSLCRHAGDDHVE